MLYEVHKETAVGITASQCQTYASNQAIERLNALLLVSLQASVKRMHRTKA